MKLKAKIKRIFALVMTLALLPLAACSTNTAPSNSATTAPQSETTNEPPYSRSIPSSTSNEGMREVNAPSELIGTPDLIYIVKGENERTIEPGADEYDEILELLRSSFPEKLKEAARAITWADGDGFQRNMMREEFDFLELSYDKAQTVKMNCMDPDYQSEEITFEMMIFPLSEITGTVSIDTHKTSGFIGRTYGPLNDSTEFLAKLLGYAGFPINSQSEALSQSSTPHENGNPITDDSTNTNAPILDGANFYADQGEGSTTIWGGGFGKFSLNYDQAKNLYGNMSFAGLEPTAKDYKMDMYGPGEAIVFIYPDFSHELRLDKATGIAMYQTEGQIYYYTFPDYEYEAILEFVTRAYNGIVSP